MNGLGIGSGQHARLISELAMAPMGGRKMAQEEIGGQMKIGLMAEEGERRRRMAPLQERQAQLGVETGEIGLENIRKAQEYSRRFAEEYKLNPKQDVFALKKRVAGEVGLPEEVFQAIEEGGKKFEAALKTGIDIFKFAGKEGLKRWLAERPELAEVISISDLPEDPVRGIMVKFPDGTELKAVRDEATGKVEIVKPTEPKEARAITEVEILSLPETDPRKQSYMKAKKEISTKDSYFQSVGIIEETNELIGYDTRTFETKRVPISGMPIKPGTVKSTSPVAQAMAEAMKEKGQAKGAPTPIPPPVTPSPTPLPAKKESGLKMSEEESQKIIGIIRQLKTQGTSGVEIMKLMKEQNIDLKPFIDLIAE